jgi:hypothetical protein
MFNKQAAFISFAIASFGVAAQSSPRRPFEDLIPIILMNQAMVQEHKQACIKNYPDLEAKIEAEHRAWPLSQIKVAISVNGREYTSPLAVAARNMIQSEIKKKDEQRMRKDCSNFVSFLDMAGEGLSNEALSPFLK